MTDTTATDTGRKPLAEARTAGKQDDRPQIAKLLQAPTTVDRFKQIVPRHLNPERMLRTMAQAVWKTPKLAECHPITLLGAMMACGSLGLEPNTVLGHAYLIPFEKRKKVGDRYVTEAVEVNLIIGYKGYIDLARRSGSMVSIHADVVYKGDMFSYEYGSEMHLKHRPEGDSEGRAKLWAYAHASLKDGQAFEVLPYARVLRIRDNSEGYKAAQRQGEWAIKKSPWFAHEHEMSSKTMVRRLAKMLPLSIEFANAAALDEMSETGSADLSVFADGVDMGTADVDQARIAHDPEDNIATVDHDPETGEIKTQAKGETVARRRATKTAAAEATAERSSEPEGGTQAEPQKKAEPAGDADKLF